jgi:hypothetical protein
MTRKQLVAEILTDLRQYDESGLIDYRSLNMWIKNELKRFGANITVLTEKVLEVENGSVELPDDFWTLHLAVKCNPESHHFTSGCKDDLIDSRRWTQRIQNTYVWDNQSNSHTQTDYKEIIEKVYYNNAEVVFRYSNPTILKLTKGFKKEFCSTGCKNMQRQFTHSAYHEINILGNKIQTNFKEGTIYIQYHALPTDDSGDIYIPDVRSLQEYIIYYSKRRILESLWLNDDDANLVNKLQYVKQQEHEYLGLAMTQVKMESLGDWDKRIKRKIVAETNRFERMFPNV